ncbi:MAG TPA: hypothetical protein VGI76_00765 [Solirubrobacteraceae bacterium]
MLRIERADLVLVAHTLGQLEAPVHAEVAAARGAWPAIVGGLPSNPSRAARLAIATADARAHEVALPRFFDVEGSLTGPAAGLGALLKAYTRLTQRGWRVTTAASKAEAHERQSPAAASFLRANSGLYIYCVYDGHYDLSLVGKQLESAYRKLGGPEAFGGRLTDGEVQALARGYSIAATRLMAHPLPRVHV